jgi:hypothetical protein
VRGWAKAGFWLPRSGEINVWELGKPPFFAVG